MKNLAVFYFATVLLVFLFTYGVGMTQWLIK